MQTDKCSFTTHRVVSWRQSRADLPYASSIATQELDLEMAGGPLDALVELSGERAFIFDV
jgi:hypothetical protein